HRRSHHSDNVQLAACAPCAVRPSTWQPPAFPESAAIDRITGDSYGSRTFETGSEISDQTVGNVLRRHALPPAPERKRTTTWQAFIRTHLALLAGADFFTAEGLTLRGVATFYVLFFFPLLSPPVDVFRITLHPPVP